MIASILMNFLVGKAIGKNLGDKSKSKALLFIGVLLNCLLLIVFKYANFLVENVNLIFPGDGITIPGIHLPLGISFFTFQAISYLVDVYRRQATAQRSLLNLGLYISLFPQLIAGPIVRYEHIAKQIEQRSHSLELFYSGVVRFIFGLSKKMLIANPLGEVADNAFAISSGDLTAPMAWVGITAYALQIYFDFSGYSDMAIGLGRMFGFRFLENFNYPYISRSLREFWQRWHISLSHWFRDYLYIPLGGSRNNQAYKTYRNLLIVFLLTGIWHGASWNFVVWGLLHGAFLAAEHAGMKSYLPRLWRPLQHIYLLVVVLFAWVFFRAENLDSALVYCAAMLDLSTVWADANMLDQLITRKAQYAFVFGILFSLPIIPKLFDLNSISKNSVVQLSTLFLLTTGLLYLSILEVSSATFNPFIYFRF